MSSSSVDEGSTESTETEAENRDENRCCARDRQEALLGAGTLLDDDSEQITSVDLARGYPDLYDDLEEPPELTRVQDDVAYLLNGVGLAFQNVLRTTACTLGGSGTTDLLGLPTNMSRRNSESRIEGHDDNEDDGDDGRHEGPVLTSTSMEYSWDEEIRARFAIFEEALNCMDLPCLLAEECLRPRPSISRTPRLMANEHVEPTSEEEDTATMASTSVSSSSAASVSSVPLESEAEDSSSINGVVSVVESVISVHIVPETEGPSSHAARLLSTELMQQLQGAMPKKLRYKFWKRLFSIRRDGDSFETFLRNVHGHSSTLLVAETTTGDIFGGFADEEWDCCQTQDGQYAGTGTSFLFTIKNDNNDGGGGCELQLFRWQGRNDYSQYCSRSDGSLGMGGGGQKGMFGLYVHSNFSSGVTGPCDTYGNKEPLSPSGEYFTILAFEVYGFVSRWQNK